MAQKKSKNYLQQMGYYNPKPGEKFNFKKLKVKELKTLYGKTFNV